MGGKLDSAFLRVGSRLAAAGGQQPASCGRWSSRSVVVAMATPGAAGTVAFGGTAGTLRGVGWKATVAQAGAGTVAFGGTAGTQMEAERLHRTCRTRLCELTKPSEAALC